EGVSGVVVEEMNPDRRCRVEPAGEWIGRRSRAHRDERQVQDARVLRGVRESLLHDVIAPGEVAVELAAGTRGAGNHETAVPRDGKPEQEAGFAGRVVRDPRVELDAGNGLGDRSAVGRI